MAANMYRGIKNIARIFKRMYIGVNNKARPIRKAYIGIDGIARLCFETQKVIVSYVTSLTSSFSSKTVYVGDLYPTSPTVTPANSNRVDFWFPANATAKKSTSKKYIDYPWYAYADANSDLYTKYGYAEDLLAKHWNETGKSKGLSLGDAATLRCLTEEDHIVQHVYRPKAITLTAKHSTEAYSGYSYVTIKNSKGNTLQTFSTTGAAATNTYTVYPGMKITITSRYWAGISESRTTSFIKLNGTTVVNGAGSYTYTVPTDIKAMTISLIEDDHLLGQSWQITATTTKF